MSEQSIYKDIAIRTGGDIYIGVVGPVRYNVFLVHKGKLPPLVPLKGQLFVLIWLGYDAIYNCCV